MSYWERQPSPPPATAYYLPPPDAPQQGKELTVLAVLAFVPAMLFTVFVCVQAAVIGRAVRTGGDQGLTGAEDLSVDVYYLAAGLGYVALLAGWVTGSMWLRRARVNAERFEPYYPFHRSVAWAWWGWIVPIVAFWFPYQIVRDVDTVADRRRGTWILGWWWGLFLAMEIGRRIIDGTSLGALETGDTASRAQSIEILMAVVTVAALALWGLVLRRITQSNNARIRGITLS